MIDPLTNFWKIKKIQWNASASTKNSSLPRILQNWVIWRVGAKDLLIYCLNWVSFYWLCIYEPYSQKLSVTVLWSSLAERCQVKNAWNKADQFSKNKINWLRKRTAPCYVFCKIELFEELVLKIYLLIA